MSENGYCYAYRGAWTHPAFNNLKEAAIWNFLYQNAFWEDGERNFNGHTFLLKRGQIVVSIGFLAKGFGMTDKGVRVVIQKLEKLGMLVKQGASKGTILTICNYDKYQESKKTKGEHKGRRGANEGRAEGDNNNKGNKEGIEGINETISIPPWLPIDDWNDFLEMRKKNKSPPTDKAKQMLITKLGKLRQSGNDPSEVLQQSTMNNYKGIFEVKNDKRNNKSQSSVHDDFTKGVALGLAKLNEKPGY